MKVYRYVGKKPFLIAEKNIILFSGDLIAVETGSELDKKLAKTSRFKLEKREKRRTN